MRIGKWSVSCILTAAMMLAAENGYNLFQKGLARERAEADPRAAIKIYEQVVRENAKDRKLSAQALVRMAECYTKLGDTQSRNIYERILRDYADQTESAELARKKIGEGTGKNAGIVTRQVWTGPNANAWGSVSPDGRYLSFEDKATGDLALHDLVTGEDRRLTHHTAGVGRESVDFSIFSPDGKQIAYVWYNSVDRGHELRLMALNGSGGHRILYKNADVRYPGPWAWSADGKWIAVQLQRNDRTVQIALLSPADGSHRVLKSVGWGGAGSMAFSPDGRYLAYNLRSSQVRGSDIFVLATDGSRENPLVVHPNSSNEPVAWAPDGKHLLFQSDRSGVSSLWAVPVQDGKPQGASQLLSSGVTGIWGMTRSGALYYSVRSNDTELYTASIDVDSGKLLSAPVPEYLGQFGARWSPDGKFLAHGMKVAVSGTFSRIRIRSVETGQARELGSQMRYIHDFVWSADSRSFAAAGADLKGRFGIYRLNAQSGEVEAMIPAEVVATGQHLPGQPRFAPGGKKLFYRKNFRKQGDVAVSEARFVEKDLVSGTERELVDLKRQGPGKLGFVPSPDGHLVAYQSRDEANGTSWLTLLPLDGGEPRELLRLSAPQSLELCDWTPDGRNLIIRKVLSPSGDGELLLFPVAGGSPRKIGIDNPRARAVSIHPDGKRISYIVQGASKGEVVVMENLLSALEKGR